MNHADPDLYNRRQDENGSRDADDSDREPCAAKKCEQNEDTEND
jgi:hypothetical protein